MKTRIIIEVDDEIWGFCAAIDDGLNMPQMQEIMMEDPAYLIDECTVISVEKVEGE
jgi:hypothetical protein